MLKLDDFPFCVARLPKWLLHEYDRIGGCSVIDHIRVAAKALIPRRSDEVLLVRRAALPGSSNPMKYNPPGGAIEPGETLVEGLKREVLEETALEVSVEGILGVREWEAPRHKAHYVTFYFVCKLIGPSSSISLNGENCEYIWANSKAITDLALMESSRGIVEEFLVLPRRPLLPYEDPVTPSKRQVRP